MTSHTLPLPGRLHRDADGAADLRNGRAAVARPASSRSRLMRAVRGPEDDPAWARPALWALLAATAALYFWGLTASGYANEFYAAAVKSASMDWRAWLFASLDSANAITVDKPPAAMWVMGLSARIFGFSSFSLLAPQAAMGVGTVALTAAAVRRRHGHVAGLVAGALIALTPVAALMFRFDNPDALLTLLMTAAGYFVVRALDVDRRKAALGWLAAAGVALGFAFLTKMLQGLLVLPALGLAYLLAARWSLWTRIRHLLAATLAMVVSAGWFVALVSLWPADARAYIGGSTNNSLWELALGYNGLGRILGGEGNGGGGGGGMGGGNTGFGGTAGILRMLNAAFGGEISWLLPGALILLIGGLVATLRRPRQDRERSSLIIWGGSLVLTALVFSFMSGTIHPYYAVAMAPALAATVAAGGAILWRLRTRLTWRVVLAAAIAATGVWSFTLLRRDAAGWLPWLPWLVIVGAVLGAMGYVALGTDYAADGRRSVRRFATIALIVGSMASLGGTTAWTAATVSSAHGGSIPTSGPAVAGGGMGRMGGAPGGAPAGSGSDSADGAAMGQPPAAAPGQGTSGQGSSGQGSSGQGTSGSTGTSGTSQSPTTIPGQGTSGQSGATGSTGSTGQQGGGQGGPGMGSTNNTALTTLLDATTSRWSAAVIGDQTAAGYILSSNTAVMSIGGWSGSDDNVTPAQFQAYVSSGQIHYFIAGGGMGGGPGGNSGSASQISSWVQAHFKAMTVGGVTVYDLTNQTS